jgi:tetratricopeptide (TPR) repeat protein/O-antigen ligase
MVIVLAVPLVISPQSTQILDVKSLALALGVTLGLSLVLLASLARGRISWVTSRLNVLVVGFLVWATLTVIYSAYRHATISEAGRLAGNVGVYWLVILSIREARQARRLIGVAAVAALAVAAYALVQKSGTDFWPWEAKGGRVFSFLGNATFLASYTVLVAPLLVAVAWPGREGGAHPGEVPFRDSVAFSIILWIAAASMLLTLYLTVSLSPIIGLALGGLLASALVLFRGDWPAVRRAMPWLIIALLLLGAFGAIGYRYLPQKQQRRIQSVLRLKDPAGSERAVQWRAGYELFRERPLLGRGYGTYWIHSLERLAPVWYTDLGKSAERMFVPSYAHNECLQVLAGTGLVGGILFIALLAAAFGTALGVARRHPEEQWRRLGLAITAAMTAFLFQNFFGVTFRQPGAVTFFWLALGLATVSAAGIPAAEEESVDGPRTRDLRFGRLSGGPLAMVAAGLLAISGVLCWLTARPVKANIMIKGAEKLAKSGRHADAAKLADEAIRLNPWDLRAHYMSAFAWGSLGNHEKSLAANKKSLELLPGNASVYYNLGVSYGALGRFKEARESFESAVELAPTNAGHHSALAEVLLKQGEYDAALEHANEAIRLAPKNPDLYASAADVEYARGNLDAAADYLRRATKVAPKESEPRKELVAMLALAGDEEEALRACRRWVRSGATSEDAHKTLVGLLVRVGEERKALHACRQWLRWDATSADAHEALVDLLVRVGEERKALDACRQWLRLEANSSDAYVKFVDLLIRQNKHDEALWQIKKAIRAGKGDSRLHLLAADIESGRRNLAGAEKYLRQGTRRFPRDVALRRALADNLMRQRKRKDALFAARKWLELEPDASIAYSIIGACKYSSGDHRAAKDNLRKALQLDAQNHTARLNLAYTYLALGQTAHAKKELKWLAARPETAQGKEAKRLLRQLAGKQPASSGRRRN